MENINIKPISEEKYYLEKLAKYLNYQLSTAVLFIIGFFVIPSIFILLLVIAIVALVFIAYMLFVFIKLKKNSWIIWFLIGVIAPSLICVTCGVFFGYMIVFSLIALIFAYFYFFMIKFPINERVKEMLNVEIMNQRRAEDQEKKDNWMEQFNR